MVTIKVKVKLSSGAYLATLHKHRASSTQCALIAVERVAGRYVEGSRLHITRVPYLVSGPDETGVQIWAFVVDLAEAN